MIGAETISLITSLAGNLFLSGLFLSALLAPIAHVNFIIQTGIWLFLVEFLSVFVGGAGTHPQLKKIRGIFTSIVGFFAVSAFALTFGWMLLESIYLPLIFLGSTAAKILGRRATSGKSSFVYPILLLLGSVFIVFVIFGPELLVNLFPFPEEFNQYVPADWAARRMSGEISGEFIDRPQTMLVWVVIYFFSLFIAELVLFLKKLQGKSQVIG